MLRFAGALHLVGGHIVIEAELDTGSVARRLRKEIAEVFGHGSEVQIVASSGLRTGSRYLVRVTKDGEGLARQSGPGRPARPAGARPSAPRGGRRHRRRRGGLAWRVPGPRLAHRAGPGLLAGDHLPVDRGGARPGRRGSPAGRGVQGPRGARLGPRRRPGRRRDRGAAHPHRRARERAGVGGTPDAARGAGHREPAGQLRRREPASFGPGRGGRRGSGRAGDGDPRRRRAGSPAAGRRGCGSSTSRRRWRSWARCPTRR